MRAKTTLEQELENTHETNPTDIGTDIPPNHNPARINFTPDAGDDRDTMDVVHQFVNTDGLLCVYQTSKDGVIDAKIPLSQIRLIDQRQAVQQLIVDRVLG